MKREYTCSYMYDGYRWSFSLMADTHKEAERRVRAIGLSGIVDGEVKATIPVPGFLAKFIMWIKGLDRE